MYRPHSAPAVESRSSVDAPVNAPKNTVLVSIAIGADRTIVGVPTLPRIASTALGPRDSAVVDTGKASAIAAEVDGHFGAWVLATWTSSSVREFISARSGL